MASTDLGSFFQQHAELTQDARARLEDLRARGARVRLTPDQLVALKERQIERSKARLEEATLLRDQAVERYEAAIKIREAEASQLEQELKDLRRTLEGGGDKKLAKVSEVSGIGATFETRLTRSGVTNVGQLVALDAARLAEALDVSVNQAETLLGNAQRFVEG
ncbi:MAG: hypothetical protein KDD11_00150 [Acidobacteria bacterium]|nr:hypothetical protein [Acidobacteriota bacterium]